MQKQLEEEGKYQACFITSKKRMLDTQFMFGTYCEVSIETLKQVKLRYIEDYEGLIAFLMDFHLLKNKPCLLALDSLDHYLETSTSSGNGTGAQGKTTQASSLTKCVRFNLIMTLLGEISDTLLDSSQVFRQ